MATVATLVSATIEEDKRFVVTLRLPPCIDLTLQSSRNAKPLPKKKDEYDRAIAAMKAAGATIDVKLTIDDVIREFKPKSQ